MAAKPEIIANATRMAQDYLDKPRLLTGIEKQRAYIAALHIIQSPCWSCAELVNYYEAVGEDYDPDNYRGAEEPFHCPHCKVRMVHVVPFIAMPHPWFWGNPKIYSKKEEEKTT
jgi:hypothetical protein